VERHVLDTRLKKTRRVICCLADRELSQWSARYFMAAGLNALACCTLRDPDRYADDVQADAVVLDSDVAAAEQRDSLFRRWGLSGLVTCLLAAHGTDVTAWDGGEAQGVRPDIVFARPLSCDGIALELSSVLRRVSVPPDLRQSSLPLVAGDVQLHPRWWQLQVHGGDGPATVLDVTAQEYRLLHTLLLMPGRTWSRDELLAVLVRGWADLQQPCSVDQAIWRLRDKLGTVGLGQALLTLRGDGYRWSSVDDEKGTA
jgi:DNA-binding response OmpR family regulator